LYKSKLKSLADDFYTLEWNAEMDFILVFFLPGRSTALSIGNLMIEREILIMITN